MQRYRHMTRKNETNSREMILMTFVADDNPYSNDDTIGESKSIDLNDYRSDQLLFGFIFGILIFLVHLINVGDLFDARVRSM